MDLGAAQQLAARVSSGTASHLGSNEAVRDLIDLHVLGHTCQVVASGGTTRRRRKSCVTYDRPPPRGRPRTPRLSIPSKPRRNTPVQAREKAIHHFEEALVIAPTFEWHYELSEIHCSLALLFAYKDRSDDAHTDIDQAKSHVADGRYCPAAWVWRRSSILRPGTESAGPKMKSLRFWACSRFMRSLGQY